MTVECPYCRRPSRTANQCEFCYQPIPTQPDAASGTVPPAYPAQTGQPGDQPGGLPNHPGRPVQPAYHTQPAPYPQQSAQYNPQSYQQPHHPQPYQQSHNPQPYNPQQTGQQPPYAPQPQHNGMPPHPGTGTMPNLPTAAPAPQVRVSLTGEVIEVEPPKPSPYAPSGQTAGYGPLPTGAVSAAAMHQQMSGQMNSYATPQGERWEKFLALALPTIVITMALMHWAPSSFTLQVLPFLVLGLLGIFLGASAAVPTYEDSLGDCMFVLGASYVFGPVAGLVVIVVLGLVHQEMNTALIATLVVNILARLAFFVAVPAGTEIFSRAFLFPMPHIHLLGIMGLIDFFLVCASFFGWIFSSMFRPDGE